VLLSGVVRMPPKRAAVSRQPADAISEVLNSKNLQGAYPRYDIHTSVFAV